MLFQPLNLALLALCTLFGIFWLIERRNLRKIGKTLTQKWSKQIEAVRTQLDESMEPLYGDLKLIDTSLEYNNNLESFDTITELEPIDNKQWNNQLTLLKMTVQRQQQVQKHVRKIAARKEVELRAFNYTISHDLKTPLNNALYFMDLALARNLTEVDDELIQYVEQTKHLLLESRDMIDSIAAYSYADNVDLSIQEIDLVVLLNKIIRQLRQSVQNDDQTTIDIEATLPTIFADPLLIRQAFTNLISNALKFTKYNPHPQIKIKGSTGVDFVEISIADNGAGIPAEGINQIFQLFHTAHTRAAFEGTGAGLAIVKRIVNRHQGTIWVESPGKDQGATFYLRMPLSDNAKTPL